MAAAVIKFPKKWKGEKNNRLFIAHPKISYKRLKRRCGMCNRPVRRSYRTGILHSNCFTCRYLMMIYGPNIEVRYIKD